MRKTTNPHDKALILRTTALMTEQFVAIGKDHKVCPVCLLFNFVRQQVVLMTDYDPDMLEKIQLHTLSLAEMVTGAEINAQYFDPTQDGTKH